MQVNSPCDAETLVAAAEVPRCDIDSERFADAVEHVAVPGRSFGCPYVPQAQIDVEVRAFDGGKLAKVEDVLQVTFRCLAGEFCVSMGRKVDLPYRWAGKDAASRTLDGGAVGSERQLELRLFQLLEVMYEAGMQCRFAEDMEKDVLCSDFLRSRNAGVEKPRIHECSAVGRTVPARAKTAAQVAGIRYFDVHAFHRSTPC